MKIYLNNPNESWVVDRFRSEWYQDNKDISTKSILLSDIIWLIAPLTWKKISNENLSKKKLFAQYITLILINLIQKKKHHFTIEKNM